MKIKTAAKSLICNKRDEVLLLVRSSSDSHAPGRYDFPGGEVNPGEDLAAAASRELQEETGISIPAGLLRLVFAQTTPNESEGESVNRVFFIGKVEQSEVVLSFEHSDYIWVSLDEAIKCYEHPFYGTAMKYIRDHNLLSNLPD